MTNMLEFKVGDKVRIMTEDGILADEHGVIVDTNEGKILAYQVRLTGGGLTFWYKASEIGALLS